MQNPLSKLPSQSLLLIPQPNRIALPGGWFEPDGHRYFDGDGNRILSVTQIFQLLGLIDYGDVDPCVLERKSKIGIAVHKAIELLLQHTLDWDTVDDEVMSYVVGAELWFRENRFELIACEQQGILETHGMKIGYQYDQRGWIQYQGKRRQVIIDLKTTAQKSATWPLQTAAYALSVPLEESGQRPLRVVLHLQKDERPKPLFYEDSQDEITFLYMAYCAIWKRNHGYALASAA